MSDPYLPPEPVVPPAAPGPPPPPPPPPTYAQPYAQPYSAPGAPMGGYGYPAKPQSSGKAIASLVLGIVGILGLCFWGLGIVAAILAVIFGFLARSEIKRSQGAVGGEGMAMAGLVTGFVGIGLFVVGLIFVLLAFTVGSTTESSFESTQTTVGGNV
jgi:hypothetical protein